PRYGPRPLDPLPERDDGAFGQNRLLTGQGAVHRQALFGEPSSCPNLPVGLRPPGGGAFHSGDDGSVAKTEHRPLPHPNELGPVMNRRLGDSQTLAAGWTARTARPAKTS